MAGREVLVKVAVRVRRLPKDSLQVQLGITGLSTAIVLISFVIVASVFAFAILTTGLFSASKARETATNAMRAAASTLQHKGSIFATESNGTADTVAEFRFKLANLAGSAEVSLLPATTLVVYIDSLNAKHAFYVPAGGTPATADSVGWRSEWLLGDSDTVDPGEMVEIFVNIDGLANPLRAGTQFKLELIPARGPAVTLERTIPLEITSRMDLD